MRFIVTFIPKIFLPFATVADLPLTVGASSPRLIDEPADARSKILIFPHYYFFFDPRRSYSLLYNGYRVFPGVKSSRSVTLTPQPLRICLKMNYTQIKEDVKCF